MAHFLKNLAITGGLLQIRRAQGWHRQHRRPPCKVAQDQKVGGRFLRALATLRAEGRLLRQFRPGGSDGNT